MKKIIVTTYQTTAERLQELKRMKSSMQKARSSEKKLNYEKDFIEVQQLEKGLRKKAEACIDALNLLEGEKEMAHNYYIELKQWRDAFIDSSLCQDLSEKMWDRDFADKLFEAAKKNIQRALGERF